MKNLIVFIFIGFLVNLCDGQEKLYKEKFDVVYYQSGNLVLKLDLFIPNNLSKPTPVVIGLHGGAWRKGTRKDYHRMCKGFADNGYIAASVSYRLSGEAPFPAQIQDVQAAIRWLKINASRFMIDPNKIVVTGHSAGGHLAALAGTSGNAEDTWESLKLEQELNDSTKFSGVKPTVAYVIAMGAQSDFETDRIKRISTKDFYSEFLNGSFDENPENYRLASPLTHLDKNDPPTVFICGSEDDPSTRGENFRHKLSELNIKSDVLLIEGAPHSFLPNPIWKESALKFSLEHLDNFFKN